MLRQSVAQELRHIVGEGNYLDSREDLLSYSYDSSVEEAVPEAVLLPSTTEQISEIMKTACREAIPVTPRGAGTNLSGGTIPVNGGIVLALTRMDRLVELNREDRYAVVQAGCVNLKLQNEAKKAGLFYPPDPASWSVSTLGGNVGENAGGPRGVKYGVTRDWILGLKVVLADGRIIAAGGVTTKNVTGIDLISLFTGSEGCLGIVTEVTVKLLPLPSCQRSIQAFYPRLDGASATVARIIGSGIVPVALELMDRVVVNLIEDSARIGLPRDVEGTLLIMVDGEEEVCQRQAELIETICREEGALDVQVSRSSAEEEKLWAGRRSAFGVVSRRRPTCVLEDCTVPVSNLVEMIRGIVAIGKKYNLLIGVLAHAGDGNTHPMILTDKRDREEWKRVEKAVVEIFQLAVALRGTLSGEHGIGLSKKPFLPLIMNEDARKLMAEIKSVLDPGGILNPGKFIGP